MLRGIGIADKDFNRSAPSGEDRLVVDNALDLGRLSAEDVVRRYDNVYAPIEYRG